MLPRNHPDRIQVAFDDHRLVNNVGLLLPATLALHLGLPQLVDRHLDLRSILSEPPMIAAIDLYQHPLSGHTLSTNTVLRWTSATRTGETGSDQYASQRVTGYVYTITFSQQFAQTSVVDS